MSKVKVLFFAADPLSIGGQQPRLLLDKEAREIRDEMVGALYRDRIEFVPCGATRLSDLRRELLRVRPQIVHFSGHGGSNGLVLEAADGRGAHRVDSAALYEFFSAFRDQIRVVVLNACHSRPQAQAIADAVGCAIGTPSRIMDEAAITFSAAFYSSIAYGQSVQAAFDQACATLKMGGFADHEDPQLVVREDVDASQLFLIPQEDAPAELLSLIPPVKPARRLARPAAAVLLTAGAAFAGWMQLRPDPACAPARTVLREVLAARAPGQARVGLLDSSAASARSDDLGVRARELTEANRLHRAGNHAADLALFRQAAEAGNPEAMTSLGLAYLRGEGTPVQADSGIKWLRAAARKEDPRGMTELGSAYLRGEGVDRNLEHLAIDYFERAAAKGYGEAMRNLGELYREGRGVDRDGALALDWYMKAVRAGFLDAMADVGNMYDEGLAVPRDRKLAFCWYDAAADAGSKRGKAAIGIVDDSLSKADDVGD